MFLLLYRDHEGQVRFLELNTWSAALLQLIQAEPGQQISTYLAWLQPYVAQCDSELLLAQVTPLLTDFTARGIVIAWSEN